ncbi:MAG TPA: high-affinity nickel-transporter, partial [Blastocatellia bacterium]
MLITKLKSKLARLIATMFGVIVSLAAVAAAHPLGNFTINHFVRIEAGPSQIKLHYVIDMAEIPAFQETQAIDADHDGVTSEEELTAYLDRQSSKLAEGLQLTIDGRRQPLTLAGKRIEQPAGAGGLATLRIELDFIASVVATATHRVRLENRNYEERIGWREITVGSTAGVSVFDSNAYANGLSDELKSYPEDMLAAPLNERTAEFSFAHGSTPEGAHALLTRDGKAVSNARDRFAELIAVKELTPGIALIGLLIAAVLGAVHAMSPGHGKTVVGAYLMGSRGTARHAAYLGLTVTVTHTLGVFALGLVTLFASNYVLPEKL